MLGIFSVYYYTSEEESEFLLGEGKGHRGCLLSDWVLPQELDSYTWLSYVLEDTHRECDRENITRCPWGYLPYSGYFSGGNIFMVFVVGRRTTKYLPTKTPHACTQNRRQTAQPRNFSHEIAKIMTFTKILPLEKYPLYGIIQYSYTRMSIIP